MVIGKLWRSAAALAAASLLLVGCGSQKSGGEAPTRAQVKAVLPDGEAMAGWEPSSERSTTSSRDAYASKVCPGEVAEACEGVRSYGTAQYSLEEKDLLSTFQVIAYENDGSAQAAYDMLWERHRTLADARALDLGDMGEESDARLGKGGYAGEDAAVYQVRVGPLVLFGTAQSRSPGAQLGEATVKELATMFTARAEQADSGEDPSAGLTGP